MRKIRRPLIPVCREIQSIIDSIVKKSERMIERIEQISPRFKVGDFGCGEAKITEVLGNDRVYSCDHVALNEKVTACDMRSVPLLDGSLDVIRVGNFRLYHPSILTILTSILKRTDSSSSVERQFFGCHNSHHEDLITIQLTLQPILNQSVSRLM